MRPRMGYSTTHRSVRRSEYFATRGSGRTLRIRSIWNIRCSRGSFVTQTWTVDPKPVLYLRCMDGHWYRADQSLAHCPIDGWCFGTSEEEVQRTVVAALGKGDDLSFDSLRQAGVPEKALREALIVKGGPGFRVPDLFELRPDYF